MGTEFDKWKIDLEERLARHLFDNPEDAHKEAPLKRRIQVLEKEYEPGTWEVFVNGAKRYVFSGLGAHRLASAKAGELANE